MQRRRVVEIRWRISLGVCTPASGVPTFRYLPIARPPTTTGINTTTMNFQSPALVSGQADNYSCQFAAGWGAPDADYDDPAQEEHVWRQVVAGSGLLVVDGAAARCREAWSLSHAWRIARGHGNEDARAFKDWSAHYERKTADAIVRAAQIGAKRVND